MLLKKKELPVDREASAGEGSCSLEKPLNRWEELLLTVDYRVGGLRPGQASDVGNLDSCFLATL
jgi:hypothetical protein